ncbi:MAG: metallophosphoesterase [Stomatobaculum sp.]|nr:metallophosphoesterase [Stomatobaculum sp.]
MKILIVSDTHRKNENLKKVLDREPPFDMMIHLGDAEGSEVIYRKWLPVQTRLIVLKGNNDFFTVLESEKEVRIGRSLCLLTHGHYYNVSLDTELLRKEAKARGFDVAMFGHTHRPFLETIDGVTLLNPGSLSYPRQEGRRPTYMIMEVDNLGRAEFTLHELTD